VRRVGVASAHAAAPGVEREASGPARGHDQKPTGQRQILLEMNELVALAEAGVKDACGEQAEDGERERDQARLPADGLAVDGADGGGPDPSPRSGEMRGVRRPAARAGFAWTEAASTALPPVCWSRRDHARCTAR
jgi:hypothetical protein